MDKQGFLVLVLDPVLRVGGQREEGRGSMVSSRFPLPPRHRIAPVASEAEDRGAENGHRRDCRPQPRRSGAGANGVNHASARQRGQRAFILLAP